MKQQEFLKSLRNELEKNQVQNIPSILADYEEHFTHGLSKGKSEDELSESLGQPATIAKAYKTEHMINEIKNPEKGFKLGLAFSVIGRLLVIAPFNFFVLFIPGIIIFAMLISGWAVSVALGSVSLALLGTLPVVALLSLNIWAWIAHISASLGLLAMAILGGMVMFLISKYVLLSLISYLQWNLQFILQNRSKK